MSKEAFVTLATSDSYAIGALVWANSLKEAQTTRDLVIMITPDGISEPVKALLHSTFNHVEHVTIFDSADEYHLSILQRPELGITFTKLHCWRLTQYSKAVFMDADTLVLQNIDDLFDREEFSAAPDPGWPDCFNSGVFVFKPDLETHAKLMDLAVKEGSFDGGDQGLLNQYFSDWATKDIRRHLSFVYNCMTQKFYSYLPALKHFQSNVRVTHFIGAVKPWNYTVNEETGQVQLPSGSESSAEFLQRWWNVFYAHVLPLMSSDAGFTSAQVHLPGTIQHLVKEISSFLSGSCRTQKSCIETGHFSWYFSGIWRSYLGEIHTTDSTVHNIGFPFLKIHRPKFTPTVDYRFLKAIVEKSQKVKKTKAVRTGAPISRYFISVSTEEELPAPEVKKLTPVQWRELLEKEGLWDEEMEFWRNETEDAEEDPEESSWQDYCEELTGRLAHINLPKVKKNLVAPGSGSSRDRQYAWERNEIDYTGEDRFDNILKKINASIDDGKK